jgi:hypothetical protein
LLQSQRTLNDLKLKESRLISQDSMLTRLTKCTTDTTTTKTDAASRMKSFNLSEIRDEELSQCDISFELQPMELKEIESVKDSPREEVATIS